MSPRVAAGRVSKFSVRASKSCVSCVRSGEICLIQPGHRTCDYCISAKRPCRSSTSESLSISMLRTRVIAIRAELNHILRILNSADAQDTLSVIDPPLGSSYTFVNPPLLLIYRL